MPAEMLRIPKGVYDEMVADARRALPLECCGLLAGSSLRAERCYPLRNELASPEEFSSEPHDLLSAFRDMRARELELVAIYHSHPASPPVPSRTDLERNFYGDTVHVIVSLAGTVPEARAYRLGADQYIEIMWELILPA
jgi:proteasome lid subunit RPN8/RPN11